MNKNEMQELIDQAYDRMKHPAFQEGIDYIWPEWVSAAAQIVEAQIALDLYTPPFNRKYYD